MKQIMNRKLGKKALEEIRDAMRGKVGTPAKQEAVRLAERYGVGMQRIYELTSDIRPTQKTRADKGKTKWILEEGNDLWKAFELVVASKQSPDHALETVALRIREKENREANLPTLPMFQKLLAQNGFSKKERTNKKVSYRRWESKFPGEIYQMDGSSLKEGFWFDNKTRKVLRIPVTEVNKNHPNKNPNQVPVWQLCAVDDCTRRTYLKYIVKDKLNSRDMLEFELEVFAEWGLSLKTYTDNGGEMRKDVAEADILLNSITATVGGYEHIKHLPHNAKATGKVEIRHQFAQKMEKLIMLAIEEGDTVTVEKLDNFAKNISKFYNEKHVNRTTGQTPMERWWSRKILARQIPYEILKSALLSDIFDPLMGGDCTIFRNGTVYQLPRVRPYLNYTTNKTKIKVIIPENIDVILVQLPCDRADEWREVSKIVASADVAGEFKQVAESSKEQLRKRLKSTRSEEVKTIKETRKQTGEGEAIPNWNRDVEVEPSKDVLIFPQKTPAVSVADVDRIIPIASQFTSEREVSFWDAYKDDDFISTFQSDDEAKEFLLKLFGSRDAVMLYSEVESAIKNREFTQRRGLLKAV
jgi:hypothetical protein